MVVATTLLTPNFSCSGANARASMIVEQFGFVTMKPCCPPRFFLCTSSKARCSGFTSGISNGTSPSIRKAEELLITGKPARANAPSLARAMSPGKLEKISSQSSGGCGGAIVIDFTKAGIPPAKRHVQASWKLLPCEQTTDDLPATD